MTRAFYASGSKNNKFDVAEKWINIEKKDPNTCDKNRIIVCIDALDQWRDNSIRWSKLCYRQVHQCLCKQLFNDKVWRR